MDKEAQIKRAAFALWPLMRWFGYGLGAGGLGYGLWRVLNRGILGNRQFPSTTTKLPIDPNKMRLIADYFRNKKF